MSPSDEDTTPLASLSLTHVSYDPDDPISLLAAYLSLVPQALIIVYVVLIFSHRELEMILMFVGQLGCEAVNYVLKRAIKEARPSNLKGKGYGMPSSHAQYIFFFATYITLWLVLRNRYIPPIQKTILVPAILTLAVLVSSARVYLHYHSVKQVSVGVVAGVVIGVGWFVVTWGLKVWDEGRLWDWVLDSWWARVGYVKDQCTVTDLQRVAWEAWWQGRGRRKREVEEKKR